MEWKDPRLAVNYDTPGMKSIRDCDLRYVLNASTATSFDQITIDGITNGFEGTPDKHRQDTQPRTPTSMNDGARTLSFSALSEDRVRMVLKL
jgi:hypothetical protein